MSIHILIGMNLSPDWVDELSKHGWDSTHWSTIGDPKATDHEIMDWARNNDHVLFTHDHGLWDNAGVDACIRAKRHPSPWPKRVAASHGTDCFGSAESTRDGFGNRCTCRG